MIFFKIANPTNLFLTILEAESQDPGEGPFPGFQMTIFHILTCWDLEREGKWEREERRTGSTLFKSLLIRTLIPT